MSQEERVRWEGVPVGRGIIGWVGALPSATAVEKAGSFNWGMVLPNL